MNVRLSLSDPLVKDLVRASCAHERYYDALPKLQGEANWQEWSDALQHAALMAGTDAVLNGELKHPQSLEGQQSTTSEWNDNVRRTAIWRSRNESLLKAMRNASDVDFDDPGGLNACRTYLGLKSKYHITDHQRAFDLFSTELIDEYVELTDPPREAADRLRKAYDQYNHLVGCNIEQRLPENFLKLAFLDSLEPEVYGDLRKALLKDHNVLALDQGSALTFDELVNLVIVGRNRLLQEQTDSHIPVPATSSKQPAKRNISQLGEDVQPTAEASCSVPHHSAQRVRPHTNQECLVQNPRLRPENWRPGQKDKKYLAQHPEIDGRPSGLESDSDMESDSESEDDPRQNRSAGRQNDSFKGKQDGANGKHRRTADCWRDLARSCHAEIQTQADKCQRMISDNQSNSQATHPRIHRGRLSGKWLLYAEAFNPGRDGFHQIELWETTTMEQKRYRANIKHYRGNLVIGSHNKVETYSILQFSPSAWITGKKLEIQYKDTNDDLRAGSMTLWGDGKMFITAPMPLLNSQGRTMAQFAAIWSKGADQGSPSEPRLSVNGNVGANGNGVDDGRTGRSERDESSEAINTYDQVIRTDRRASVTIKEEDTDSDMVMNNDNDYGRPTIKAEESDSSDSDDEWADDVTTAIDTVQKQSDAVRGGSIIPLHELSGEWYFHSRDYRQPSDGDILIWFFTRQEHEDAERMCAPGHCKPSASQTRYCGELRFKAKEGERDFYCLIKQFDVLQQTSLTPVRIEMWDPINKRTIYMSAWFFGQGTMRMSIPTLCIRDYCGQHTMITFSGLKHGWPRGA